MLILYLILATTYSIVVPIGRGADEWAHYWYAQFIAQNGRLPATPAERETAGYKSDWPPLYHLAAAGLTAWINTDGPPTFKYRADNIRRQLIPAQGSEAILHTEDELFPWRQEILVWHLGRFLSIVFSSGTLLVTYFIVLELFFDRQTKNRGPETLDGGVLSAPYTLRGMTPQNLGLIAVALLAFNPRFLFTSMLFNYDGLTLLVASLFLWIGIRIARGYHPRWGFWSLGALAGLALVTKYLTVLLPLEIIIVAIFRKKSESRNNTSGSKHSMFIHLGQAALVYLIIVSLWFGYLLINFNEVDTYGPVLGTVAPLLRGDGSDRTVEEIFSWLSGGQAPPPAFIEKQSYTIWQIITEFPTTFWGNPIVRPYPLDWFIWAASVGVLFATVGLILFWWGVKHNRFWLNLLLLHAALPLPFMAIRLFGARNALEAVQGRHILFLSAPAIAILLVVGWWSASHILANILRVFPYALRLAPYTTRILFILLLGLLSTGALAQLVFMADTYAHPLPIKSAPHVVSANLSIPSIILEGGATLIDYHFDQLDQALQVTLVWQGGENFASEDYRIDLRLVDDAEQSVSGWQAYQTQARYPTRAWEPGDIVQDVGWLPLTNLAAGDYEIQLRILGKDGPVTNWQTLGPYTLWQMTGLYTPDTAWTLWHNGQPVLKPVTFNERETALITIHNPKPVLSYTEVSKIQNPKLIGPDGIPHDPVSTEAGWANFIIQPDWPAGDYYLAEISSGLPALRVAEPRRQFELPSMTHSLDVDFEGQVKLVGYDLPMRRVEPGGGLPVTLYWQGMQWMGEDFVIFNRLLDNQQTAFGGYDRLPKENYSTLLWAPGEIVVDGFAVPVASDAHDGVYTLDLGLYRHVGDEAQSLQIVNPENNEPTGLTSVTIGPIKVGQAPQDVVVQQVEPQIEVDVVLGDKIKLLGFDITSPIAGKSGESDFALVSSSPLELIFYWDTLDLMDVDYTVFTHIRNAAGETVTQKDAPPANGAYPTSLWDTGEIIRDDLSIPLEQLEPGRYELIVGMYDFTTGIRLPVEGSAEGTILLHSFEVSE